MKQVIITHYNNNKIQLILPVFFILYVLASPWMQDPKIDLFDLVSVAVLTIAIPLFTLWTNLPSPADTNDTAAEDLDEDPENDPSEDLSTLFEAPLYLHSFSNTLWLFFICVHPLVFERYIGWNDDGIFFDVSELISLAGSAILLLFFIPTSLVRWIVWLRKTGGSLVSSLLMLIRLIAVLVVFCAMLFVANIPGNILRQMVIPLVWSVEPNGYVTKSGFIQDPYVLYTSSDQGVTERFVLLNGRMESSGELNGLVFGHYHAAQLFVDFE